MPAWTHVAVGYAIYLAGIAWFVPRFARARLPALIAAGVAAVGAWWWPALGGGSIAAAAVKWVVVPSLALLGAYRVSGWFFIAPWPDLEQVLLRIDDALLNKSGVLGAYRAAGRVAHGTIELLYLLVYVTVPLGALILLLVADEAAVAKYWVTVFTAELACYAALPWLQSRPPRALAAADDLALPGAMRALNLRLLAHGSVQANTIPSGHAAGAVAVALSVYSAAPGAGLGFLLAAAGITVATVLGRYHYAVDSILGVLVAMACWLALGR
jgi:hypothetical protein